MANAFTLFGELKADTGAFERSLKSAISLLDSTAVQITKVEQRAASLGDTSATTGRKFEKFNETVGQQKKHLMDAAEAYLKGEIGAKKFAQVVNQTDSKVGSLNSKLKDSNASLTDWANRSKKAGSAVADVFKGTLGAIGVANFGMQIKNFAQDSMQLYASLDKLTRYTSTLDEKFQTPAALHKFREDVIQLSEQMPHSAEAIAKASFQVKSAFQDMQEPELINFLREMGTAATASNVSIDEHANRVVALAKAYKIPADKMKEFGAVLTTTFGRALAIDDEVGKGFQELISPALRAGQSFTQLAAAMGAMQSMSTDAATNSTMLKQVLNKLVDPKFAKGMQDIGVSIYDAGGKIRPLVDIVEDLRTRLQGLSDQEKNFLLGPIMKDQRKAGGWEILLRTVDEYRKDVEEAGKSVEGFEKKNEVMADSAAAKWQRFQNKVDAVKLALAGVVVQMADDLESLSGKTEKVKGWMGETHAIKIPPPKLDSEAWGEVIGNALRAAINNSTSANIQPAKSAGQQIGSNMTIGMELGLMGGRSGVVQAAINIATAAWTAAKQTLGIQSPSKVFFAIGQDTAQGFIDGIASMRTGVMQAMAKMLDVSGIKGLTKNDAPGVDLLRSLIEELDKLTPRTKLEEVQAELTAGKYAKLNAQVRERILLAAKQLTLMKAMDEERQRFLEHSYDSMGQGSGRKENDNGIYDSGLSGGEQVESTGGSGLSRKIQAALAPPKLKAAWEDFWGTMKQRMAEFKASLPTLKQAIGENLIDALGRIGDVFGNAIRNWDGTAKGFFKSLAQGFRELVADIASQLVRLMVIKAVMSLIGAAAGGGGGGGLGSGGDGSGFAAGGYTGDGGESQPAGIVHGKEFVMNASATRKWGKGFFEALNAGFAPMALAGGGMSGGGSNTTYGGHTVIVNMQGGSNDKRSAEQIANEVIKRLHRQEMRNK